MKIKKFLFVAFSIAGIFLLSASAAQAVVNPSNNAICITSGSDFATLYVPDNNTTPEATPGIRIYRHGVTDPPVSYWREQTSKRIALEGKTYGLTAWMNEERSEGKLLATVNKSDGRGFKLISYNLDASGYPTGFPQEIEVSALGASPMGVAILSTGDRAYVADASNGRLYYFKHISGGWREERFVVADYNVNSIALTPAQNTYTMRFYRDPFTGLFRTERVLSTSTYKIFVTVKGSAGKVLIFNYNYSGGTETITKVGEITGLSYPTYVKVSPQFANKLFVAVNGSSGGDMKLYSITTAEPYLTNARTVTSIPGAYGWTGFDVSYSENYLFFSQAANVKATQTYIYRVALPLSGDYTVTDSNRIATINKNIDGLALSKGYTMIVGTYSGDGSIAGDGTLPVIDTGVFDQSPNPLTDLTDMGQFVYPEGTTAIPEGGPTTQNRVIVKFRVSDPDGDNVFPQIEYHRHGGPNNFINLPAVPNGTTVTATIPASGVLENGEWEWGVGIKDYTGGTYSHRYFGDNLGVTDFVIDFADITPPAAVTNLAAVPGSSAGQVNLTWTAPGDDGMGGMVSGYQVRYATLNTPFANPFTDANFTTTGTPANISGWSSVPFVAGGATENRTLTLLPYDPALPTYIWIAIRAFDEVPNYGPLGANSTAETLVRNHIPPPTVTRVYPSRAPNTAATNIVIEGTNFIGGAIVNLSTTPMTPLTINSLALTRIEAVVPTGLTPGTYNISVTTGGGVSADTPADDFTVMAGPETPAVPPQVIDFRTTPGNGQVTLQWTNPADSDMAQITVRRAGPFAPPVDPANYPASPTAGTVVYGAGIVPRPGEAISYDNTGLTNGQVYYYVVYIRDTSGNWSVLDYDTVGGQNAATGQPSETAGIIITNLNIVRDADTVGSSVTVSWQTTPTAHSAVKIFTKSGDFSPLAADWTEVVGPAIIPSGDLDTYTDASQVGNGTSKYYKILPASATTLTNSDLTSDVVGKFDLIVTEGMNLLSLPLISIGDNSLSKIIGTQAVGSAGIRDNSDEIWKYDSSDPTRYKYAWLVEGMGDPLYDNKWFDPDNNESTMTIGTGEGFWYQAKAGNATPPISIVGKVADTASVRIPTSGNLEGGMNLIGTPYPVNVTLASSGLNGPATGSAGIRETADEVWKYNSSAPTRYEYAWLVEGMGDPLYDNKWFDPDNNESTMVLEPGKGYWIQAKNAPFSWDYDNPIIP